LADESLSWHDEGHVLEKVIRRWLAVIGMRSRKMLEQLGNIAIGKRIFFP